MSDVTDLEIGKLIQKVESLEQAVRENNMRLTELETQLHKTKGLGIGIILATVGLSGIGGSIISRWLST